MWVFLLETESAKLGEKYIERWLLFGVVLEDCALEILHFVGLPVQVRHFVELIRYREALLGETSVRLPIFEEQPANSFARFREKD